MKWEPINDLGPMTATADILVLTAMILLALFFATVAIWPSFKELFENRRARHADRDNAAT